MNQRVSVLLDVMVHCIGEIIPIEYGSAMLAACCDIRADVNRVLYICHAERIVAKKHEN
jgi:hypothetical protein